MWLGDISPFTGLRHRATVYLSAARRPTQETTTAISYHNKRAEARSALRQLGMQKTGECKIQRREYWGYVDGRKNVMLDHTATITKVDHLFAVSNFAN